MIPMKRKRGASRYSSIANHQREMLLHKWLQRAVLLLVLTTGALGIQWLWQQLSDSSRFPLRYIHLYGDLQYVKTAALQKELADYLGHNFFSLNIKQLHSLLMAEPWIEQVEVKRDWPDRLLIEIKERQVFARWNEDELLDVNGVRISSPLFSQAYELALTGGSRRS